MTEIVLLKNFHLVHGYFYALVFLLFLLILQRKKSSVASNDQDNKSSMTQQFHQSVTKREECNDLTELSAEVLF